MRRVVTVLSKAGCRICEDVLAALAQLSSRYDLEVRVLDIMGDPELHDRYCLTIPVVRLEGKDVLDARDLVGANCARSLELLLKT